MKSLPVYAALGIIHGAGMLVFVSNAQVDIAVDTFQELRVDEVLFLGERCFRVVLRMIAEAPEVVRVITIGGLEAEDMVFFGEEDGRAEDQDQL